MPMSRFQKEMEKASVAHEDKMREEMLKTFGIGTIFLQSTVPDDWTDMDQLEARVMTLARLVHEHVDVQVKKDIADSEGPSECGKCSYCCYQNTWVTFTEAVRIILHMRHTRKEIPDFYSVWKDIRNLPTERRFQRGIPCPLLKEGTCSIYEARPSVCRGHHSGSRLQCQLSYINRASDPKGWPTWEHLVLPKITAECASIGLDAALLREGYQVGSGLLEEICAQAARGDTVERWLRKERVFKTSRNPDGHLAACQAVVAHTPVELRESDGKPGNEPGTIRIVNQEDPGKARDRLG